MTAALPIQRAPESWRLVERAQAGDRDAFADIYRANYDGIFKYILFRTGNHALAEDLTHDVFLRALRNLVSVTWQGRDIGAWLTTIAKNLVADHFKSGHFQRTAKYSGGLIVDSIDGWKQVDALEVERVDQDPMADPANAALAYLTGVLLLTVVRSLLTDEQQQVLIHRFFNGLSIEETAQAMGKNDGAIKALQYRATQRLGRDSSIRLAAVAA